MQWLVDHMTLLLGILLAVSEAAAAITQLIWPDNKGLAGVMAGIIKFLQNLKSPQ